MSEVSPIDPVERAITQATKVAFSKDFPKEFEQRRFDLIRQAERAAVLTRNIDPRSVFIGQGEMKDFLGQAHKEGRDQWVMSTVIELDPPVVEVLVGNPSPGKSERMKVPLSSHLEPGCQVFISDAKDSSFIDDPGSSGRIVLGVHSFSKERVLKTLNGKAQYQAVFREKTTSIPLFDQNTGSILWVRIPTERIPELEKRLKQGGPAEIDTSPMGSITGESHRLIQQRILPGTLAVYQDIDELKYGSASEASPDHPNEDDSARTYVYNQKGGKVALRIIGIDGSGGSLKHRTDIAENQRSVWIKDKNQFIKQQLLTKSNKDGEEALREVHQAALADEGRNPAYAGVIVADIDSTRIEISRRGDHSAVLWRPSGFSHRRGQAWGTNRGARSQFQSIDVPQNYAYAAHAAGVAGLTGQLEDEPGAGQLYRTVGEGKGVANVTTIERNKTETEWLLLMSDGGRGSGTLLDPNTFYSQEAHQVMTRLSRREIDHREAARLMTQAARRVPGERDDITVQIVEIPPAK